ncbi:MAG: PHP domain-containing protein, partial [Burkholderiales bacterium]
MSARAQFVHLHVHSHYSLLDGTIAIPDLVGAAKEHGMKALALTDHGNLFGAIEFYQKATAAGIKPIIGCETYLAPKSRFDKTGTGIRDSNAHLVLLAKDEAGYANLMRLVSASYLEGFYYKPRVDHELLALHAEGLLALSACPKGEIGSAILADDDEDAYRTAVRYREIFGAENFFLEIQDHGLDKDRLLAPEIHRLSQETGIPLVATNDSHYLRREDARAHEILMCIQTGKTMSNPDRMRWPTPEFYLKSAEEMRRLFPDSPDALARTAEIAARCRVEIPKVAEPFPRFEVPAGHTADTYFEYIAREGFERRRPRLEALRAQGRLAHELAAYLDRLDSEIRMIQQMKFSGYFLIVWDFMRFA